jgi:hypothetical protein
MRTVGGAVGGQLSAAVLTAHLAANGDNTDSGFTAAFTVVAVSLVAAVVFVLAIPGKRRGRAPAAEVPAGLVEEVVTGLGVDTELASGVLLGRVQRGTARVPAAVLTVIGMDGREVLHTRADESGEFAVHVPSGRYYVIATDEGRDPQAVAVELNGHPVTVNVALPSPVEELFPAAPSFAPVEDFVPRA